MPRFLTFGQWPFYTILAIFILFLSQTILQANGAVIHELENVGIGEFESAYEKFTHQMDLFKQRTPVIQANEDSDVGMLKIVRENLYRIRQILNAFEPIRGVVEAPEIEIDHSKYRDKINKLTKAPDNTELLLIYGYRYFPIYNFIDGILTRLLFAREKNANETDHHPETLKSVVNQLWKQIAHELLPKFRLEFDLFGKWRTCIIAGRYLDKMSTEVYEEIPIPSNVHEHIIEVAKNAAPLIAAKFEEHQKRLREITSEPCKAMDTILKRDEARSRNENMQWMNRQLEDVLTLRKKITLSLYEDMSNKLYSMAYGRRAIEYGQPHYVDEMALYDLYLKVLRIVDVENRQFFQLLTREFGAQILDSTLQMGLFTESNYQIHRNLLNAAKLLVNGVVLPQIVHIFGTPARKTLQLQRQESRVQRAHALYLVNEIVEPKLEWLDTRKPRNRHKSQEIMRRYHNAGQLYSIYHHAKDAFDTFQWLDKEFYEHDNTVPTDQEYEQAKNQLRAQLKDGRKSQRAEFVGEHIFHEWDKIKKRQAAADDGTPLTAVEDEDKVELMADGMDANTSNLHKRKAMEIDIAESQASSSHAAGDKMRKI